MSAAFPSPIVARLGALSLASLALAGGCDRPQLERGQPPASAAVLEGQVTLAEGAALPAYDQSALGWEHLFEGELGDTGCPPRRRLEVLSLGADRGLGGVVVAASGFTGRSLYDKRTHEVVLERCKLSPSMVSAAIGDRLEVINRGPGAAPLTFGPALEPGTLAEGREVTLQLFPGVESLMCAREVGCGRTDVVVFHHSLHAVTDREGRFRIEGFPAGQPVAVHAWHPLLPEGSAQVWLEPGQRGQVQIIIDPSR